MLLLSVTACEPVNQTEMLVEAPDYAPIGEAIKFIALAMLGCVVVACITSIINRDKK